MSEERIKVGIPLGVSHGQTVRIRGKGAEGPKGGKPGDLLLAIAIEAHERFQRDGSHLRLAVPLTIHEAMTGAKIEIPTLDGRIRVTIPPAVAPGTTRRIKGKGLPRSKDKRGDLFLVLQPTPPSSDTPEASDVAMQLDAFYTESPRADWDDQ
jgi:DnaJ-class molecular chaperone